MGNSNEIEQQLVITIKDKKVAKIAIHPMRIKILRCLQETHTVKELAQSLGVRQTKLYYHMDLLEKAGLIAVQDTRLVNNLEERSYRSLAKEYTIDLEEGELSKDDPIEHAISVIFPIARSEMLASYRDGLRAVRRVQDGDAKEGKDFGDRFSLALREIRLDKAGWESLAAKIDEMSASLRSDDGESFSLLYAIYPNTKGKNPA